MKQDNVIPFPKEQTLRVRLRERGHQQKAVLALSILSVLMFSVLSNQWITRAHDFSTDAGRGIASLGPVNSKADIQWEQELARQISTSDNLKAHLAEKPSLRDELIYGELEGHYGMKLAGDRIESLRFLKSRDEDRALTVKDRAALLRRFHSVFAVSFNDVGLAKRNGQVETWDLVGQDRAVVGHAQVELDADGGVTSLAVTK